MRRLAIIAVVVLVFVAVAGLLARWLSAENVERDRVTELLEAQAQGDEREMLDLIDGCLERPACVGIVRANARSLRDDGEVEIVAYDSATGHALGEARGPTRVVWKTASRLPTVQCVEVRRRGNVLSGPSVTVTGLSEPIDREAAC